MTRRLRRACEDRVRQLVIPDPFDVRALCALIGRNRGRPLRLLPMDVAGESPCGLWISTVTADYVCYQAGTSTLHQEHIILHELGHILSGRAASPREEVTEILRARRIDLSTLADPLGRSHYTRAEEREAEIIASLIRHRAARFPRDPQVQPPPLEAADLVERIGRSLES